MNQTGLVGEMNNIQKAIDEATTTADIQRIEGRLDALFNAGTINKAQLINWDLRCCDRYDEVILEEIKATPYRQSATNFR